LSASSDDEEEGFHYARLGRAAELYEQFGQVWADYLKQRPHRLTMDTDPGGLTRIRVERLTPIPLQLSLLLGEYLYELRAALDNCLYNIAVIDSGQSPPLNGELLEWPIYLTPKKWKDNQRRFAALSPALRDALEGIQPYQAQAPGWNCLRILHDLARTDRHRALHLVTLHATYGNAKIDSTLIADFKGHTGVVGVDGVVATFRHLNPQRELAPENFDYNVEFEVELAEVAEAPHPASGRAGRPWGGLDKRLQALHKAVFEYVAGLEAIAKHVRAEREHQ
jgi:hypothetical protein